MTVRRRHRPFADAAEVLAIHDDFVATTLPRTEWDHRAHLAAALVHVALFPLDEAIDRMRSAICTYNELVGFADADERGYHETITVAFLAEIDRWLRAQEVGLEGEDFVDVANRLLASDLGDPDYLLRHYSPDLLDTRMARESFVAPDRAPFPQAG